MISLVEYKGFCESLKALIDADQLVMVVHEEHLKKKLRDMPGTVIAAVLPSVRGTGTGDNTVDDNTVLVFVLEYVAKSALTEERELLQYEKTREKIDRIKGEIIERADEGDPLMMFLNRESIEIEPEWNIAGAYNGWSVAFSFER